MSRSPGMIAAAGIHSAHEEAARRRVPVAEVLDEQRGRRRERDAEQR